MNTVEAYLAPIKAANGRVTIKVRANPNTEQVQETTGVTIEKHYLNDRNFVLNTHPDHSKLNSKIFQKLDEVNAILATLPEGAGKKEYNRAKNPEKYKDEPEVVEEAKGLIEAMEIMIKDTEKKERRNTDGKEMVPKTIKGYRTTLNVLIEFQENTKFDLTDWDKISKSFYKKFTRFLYDKKKYLDSTVGQKINHIKSAIIYVNREDIIEIPKSVKTAKMIAPKGEIEDEISTYLLPDELALFCQMKLPPNKYTWERARDLFMVSYSTMARISALLNIREEDVITNINGKLECTIKDKGQSRTRHELNDFVTQSLKKYVGKLPEGYVIPNNISQKTYRDQLKEVIEYFCKYIQGLLEKGHLTQYKVRRHDWTKKMVFSHIKEGKLIEDKQFFYKKFDTHSARRTEFCAFTTSVFINSSRIS